MSKVTDMRPSVIERVAKALECMANELQSQEGECDDMIDFLVKCSQTLEDEVARDDTPGQEEEGVKASLLSRAAKMAMAELAPVLR